MAKSPEQKPSISELVDGRLAACAAQDVAQGIKQKFNNDEVRAHRFTFEIDDLYIDFSKTHISDDVIKIYCEFAQEIDFAANRLAFLSGEKINASEGRSVLHTLLRDPSNQGIEMRDPLTLEQAATSKQQFTDQYHQVQAQLSARKTPVTDIIHVGIGGSSLGTRLVFEALKAIGEPIKVHFIGNIDAHELVSTLNDCSFDSTLVIGVSKTFTTAETLQNLDSIAAWFAHNGVDQPLTSFYGVTANPEQAASYGIPSENIVSFPQWVGGRYSVWSSVSLSAALVLGMEKFESLLEGAAAIDQHFYQREPTDNICFIAALLDHYYGNYLGVKSRAIFAYDYRLRSLVDYLQQLETESNGKDRQRDGSRVDQQTSPVIWGGVGTDVQHSVFQMLHQGTSLIPAEFILVKTPDHALSAHHLELLANGLAQPAALLAGQDYQTVSKLNANEDLSELTKRAKIFSGDRPSTTILLDKLTPTSLGALLAFYEHRTFISGIFANINSYDQMGVELGKRLARQVKPLLDASDEQPQPAKAKPADDAEGFDPSTLNLVARVLANK